MYTLQSVLAATLAASLSLASPILKNQLSAEDEALARRYLALQRRDNLGCPPMQYRLPFVDYYDCPHKYVMDSNGNCIAGIAATPVDGGCFGYCEVKQTLIYGTEAPFSMPFCTAGTACQLTTAYAVANTTSIAFNMDINGGGDGESVKAGFDLGATFTWSQTITNTITETINRPQGEERCGYWTFVPYMVSSCGTLTSCSAVAAVDSGCEGMGCVGNSGDPMEQTCDTSQGVLSTPNYCNTSPVQGSNGQTAGKVLFVAAPCNGGDPFPDGQDPVYYQRGVSADPNWHGDASTARTSSGTPDGDGKGDPNGGN